MSTSRFHQWFWLIVVGLTLPVSVVLSTNLARRSFEKVKLRDQTITVKGYAERKIQSDRASWSLSIVAREAELVPAYSELETGRDAVFAFLREHGFKPEDLPLSPVDITVLHPLDKEGNALNAIEGYVLRQQLSLTSEDVDKVARTARDASDLIRQNVELESESPQFICSRLNDLKLEMLGEATANARQRAELLVSHSHSRLGALRGASQGVFQITPAYSSEVSDSGINDQSTVSKAIKAVVTVEYAIE
ncbi:MAG: SIMPL domain-containing protein [Phycisphaeraceae bacterium]|nr:SIMPL domain-containing protein [Phycisphaeraceae bacterium]